MNFQQIAVTDLNINPFGAIGQDWMLVTAGDEELANTMTASWGGLGVLWGQDVAFVFIRPQRYTKQFMDAKGCFSLSFFDGYKQEMGVLGSVSGRDRDKIAEVGMQLTMIDGVPAFEEAKLVLVLDTLYTDEVKADKFLPAAQDMLKWYPDEDFHTVYVAKIRGVYVKC